jgi:hypothetical protein
LASAAQRFNQLYAGKLCTYGTAFSRAIHLLCMGGFSC